MWWGHDAVGVGGQEQQYFQLLSFLVPGLGLVNVLPKVARGIVGLASQEGRDLAVSTELALQQATQEGG